MLAVAVWLVSGAYMLHFGSSWHLDLRVYRAAGTRSTTTVRPSPPTSPLITCRSPIPRSPCCRSALWRFGRLGLVESLWWVMSAAAMVVTLFLMLRASASLASSRAWAVAGLLGGVASLALEPVRSNFEYGQINLILMVMIVADLTWSGHRGVACW